MVFPVVMYGCESWTVKKAENWRIDAFELWCWRRLLRVPWTARRSNQFILKEISPGCSLERLMLKLVLQYFGHLMWRVDSLKRSWCWEGLGAGGEGDDRGWDGWMASQTQWTWVWVNSRSWWWTGRPGVLWFMGWQRVRHDWATELNLTEMVRICHGLDCLPSKFICWSSIPSTLAAAAAAKSRQSCPTLWDPIEGSSPGFSGPGILQARILEWDAISFSNAWKWKMKVSRSVVSDSLRPHGL